MSANLLTSTRPAPADAVRAPAPTAPRGAPPLDTRALEPPPATARPGPDAPPSSMHGALTRCAAERAFGAEELSAALDGGSWTEPWPGVVLPASKARDPLARAEAALLRAGPHSVLSGPTAAAMHGCTEADDRLVHVAVPYHRQPRAVPRLVVRQSWIREADVVELDGLRVHALDVALTEMLCTGDGRTALACLEQALAVLGDSAPHFRAVVAERLARRRDRRGTRRAGELVELARLGPTRAAPVVARVEAAPPGRGGPGGVS
ncbi:hypothetical protein ACL03H_17840 [Saccharopolyspora sp. MS10]|uniref:hypothetical protein n=1 Tax=Saccharopolyspora sp. MS10 TaxID=3385973 RepID=UPI0039A3CE97